MHRIQQEIFNLVGEINLKRDGLRQIGRSIGEAHPFKVSYHLKKLEEKGFIKINKKTGEIIRMDDESIQKRQFLAIPVLGAANCGEANIFAEDNLEGYIKVSKNIIKNNGEFLAVKAVGNSMNRSNIGGRKIESGDYVIVDTSVEVVSDSYVLAIIDNCTSLKKMIINIEDKVVSLISESTEDHPIIFLHKNDEFLIKGMIKCIIKRPIINEG